MRWRFSAPCCEAPAEPSHNCPTVFARSVLCCVHPCPSAMSACRVPCPQEGTVESGQLLFHKGKAWRGLLLALFLNLQARRVTRRDAQREI